MVYSPTRLHLPRGLVVAAVAAVALHVLGSLVLSGVGWVGRGGPSHPIALSGRSSSSAKTISAVGLQVRLTNLGQSLASQAPGRPDESASSLPPHGASLTNDAHDLLSQSPPAAGGLAAFASTYLSADEVDQGPVPEPGWILDEGALSEVGRARMLLRLWVSEIGHIDRVAVIHADPAGPWIDEAIRPLPDTRMRPAERDGRPVAATIVVELSSDLETLR